MSELVLISSGQRFPLVFKGAQFFFFRSSKPSSLLFYFFDKRDIVCFFDALDCFNGNQVVLRYACRDNIRLLENAEVFGTMIDGININHQSRDDTDSRCVSVMPSFTSIADDWYWVDLELTAVNFSLLH